MTSRWLLILCAVVTLAAGCPATDDDDVSADDDDDTGDDDATGDDDTSADCSDIDEVTAPVYLGFSIHNEEDDASCIPGSKPTIPDYNGDEAVFQHFADAMLDYAEMLASYGARLSFQPDWTFVEGVENYRPDFYDEMRARDAEILPHAHETCVMYDELYDMLVDAGAEPETILGGMTFDEYSGREEWFDAHPEFTFWDGPKGTPGHTDDAPMPPFAYRIPGPAEVTEPEDLYRHVADSPIIVTPGVPVAGIPDAKPEGRFISPAWEFNPTRSFLAESDNFSVPEIWRKQVVWEGDPLDNMSAAERIAMLEAQVLGIHLPAVAAGTVRFATAAEITALYREVEPCLDLVDDQDLSSYVEER